MFPASKRIHTTKDILHVLRHGARRNQAVVACSFVKKPGTVSRVAVIVDTKVSKKATVRNLCKRRVRAILQASVLPVGDLVVRLRPGAPDLTFGQLQANLTACLRSLA